jgi:uncharacterized protein YabE (DUF348 family)
LILPIAFVLGSATLAILALMVILVTSVVNTTNVIVIVDGDAAPIETRAETVGALLEDLSIDTTSGDSIEPSPETVLQPDMVIRVERARNVSLVVDGNAQILWTPLTNPADILALVGVTVTDNDLILVDGTQTTASNLAAWPVPVSQLSVRHVVPVTVELVDEGTVQTVMTTAATVGEALFDAGITVFLSDTVNIDMNAPITPNLNILIRRASPVSIVVDGETIRTRTQGSTVADALADAGVALVGLDYPIPAEDTRLLPGISIRVIRVREELLYEERSLPYETIYQADANMELDTQGVAQSGQNGLERTTIRVRYENNIEISRAAESTEIVTEPRNHIISYGTNIIIRTLDTPDGAIQYWRRVTMYATSYHPAALGGDSTTATGRTLVKGIVAANPDVLPYGTLVYVPGYGHGDVQDTGGPRRRLLWIDLGYSDADWVSWSRPVDVYLLAPPPDPSRIDYILPAN